MWSQCYQYLGKEERAEITLEKAPFTAVFAFLLLTVCPPLHLMSLSQRFSIFFIGQNRLTKPIA